MRFATRFALVVCLSLIPSSVFAQSQGVSPSSTSHWGIAATVTPVWTAPSSFKRLFEAQAIDVQGSDFSVGFVRGRDRSGDWGVSLVKKTFKDGSTVDRTNNTNPFGPGPYSSGGVGSATAGGVIYTTTPSSSLLGVEIHKYWSFVTIRNRFQIGMNLAGGIAEAKGSVNAEQVNLLYVIRNGQLTTTRTQTSSQANTSDIFIGKLTAIPLGEFDLGVAVIVAPGLKIKAMGGFDFPGYQKFTLGVVYLFGESR